jgi:hypothetical protein
MGPAGKLMNCPFGMSRPSEIVRSDITTRLDESKSCLAYYRIRMVTQDKLAGCSAVIL